MKRNLSIRTALLLLQLTTLNATEPPNSLPDLRSWRTATYDESFFQGRTVCGEEALTFIWHSINLRNNRVGIPQKYTKFQRLLSEDEQQVAKVRDHNSGGFTAWLAGGGIKQGTTYGSTDGLGFKAVDKIVHSFELHATALHLLGLDHERLTWYYNGLEQRLTAFKGKGVIANCLPDQFLVLGKSLLVSELEE